MKNGTIAAVAIATTLAATGMAVSTSSQLTKVSNDYAKLEKEIVEVTEERNNFQKELKEISEKLKEELQNKNNELESVKKEKEELKEKIKELENPRQVDFELTYYTDLPQENGGYKMTKYQTPLKYGVVASNHYARGTKIKINGMIFTVEDTGGSEFNSPNRLDVLVERQPGESDDQYLDRVNNIGRTQVKGTIL